MADTHQHDHGHDHAGGLDPDRYRARQAHWHPEEVFHLMPDGPDVGFLLTRWDQRVRDSVTDLGTGRVLDVGCGDARDILYLGAKGWRGCGLDPSSAQLQDARKVVEGGDGGLALVRAVAESLPFKPGSFDAVFCKSAIDHVVDRDEALDNFVGVVKPGGRILISAVNFGGVSARLSRPIYWLARRTRAVDPKKPRFWDTHVPHEHTFEGTYASMTGLATGAMKLVDCYGVSLFFGLPRWGWLLRKLPERWAQRLLERTDRFARKHPALADVIVCVWQRAG